MSLPSVTINKVEFNNVETEEADDEDDMEDDTVFVQDPTIHLKPLMHPKRRKKTVNQVTRRSRICCGQRSARSTFLTCIFVLVLVALTAFLMVYIYRNTLTSLVQNFKPSLELDSKGQNADSDHRSGSNGCDEIQVENVWSTTLPFLMSESASRLIHVNSDGVLDVVLGFGTGVDSLLTSRLKCEIYFGGRYPCFGGLVALDGRTGRELWRQYDIHEMFAVNCDLDLNGDGFKDCIGAGRGAAFSAVNGRNGSLLWRFRNAHASMNFYTPQGIPDIDHDGIPDLVQVHGGDPVFKPEEQARPIAMIVIVSGRTGRLISARRVPDYFESYYSPQVTSMGADGGEKAILLGTGGETHGGSLYMINLRDFNDPAFERDGYDAISIHRLYSDRFKGVMTPPVLADITGDGIEDIVISMFNSTVVAIDGRPPHKILWKFSMPDVAESYNTPAIGFYNNDSVPDFMVQYSVGPGYPIYYYSQVLILDGRNGAVLARPSRSNTGIQASPLTVSFKQPGSDLFLFWSQTCRGHEHEMNQHSFSAEYSQAEQSRAHLCKIKYNTTTVTHFVVSGRQTPPTVLYNSEAAFHSEHDSMPNATRMGLLFVRDHPELGPEFQRYLRALKTRPARRKKRHVGPHDNEGLQRAISTGCLAPSLNHQKASSSEIDVIFSTYWSEPSEAILSTKKEDECVKTWMSKEKLRFNSGGAFYGMDHDHYQMAVKHHCHNRYGRRDVAVDDYNEFDIHVGQLTIYRRRLKCVCKSERQCPQILPFERQGWAGYMGSFGNSHWNSKAAAMT